MRPSRPETEYAPTLVPGSPDVEQNNLRARELSRKTDRGRHWASLTYAKTMALRLAADLVQLQTDEPSRQQLKDVMRGFSEGFDTVDVRKAKVLPADQ